MMDLIVHTMCSTTFCRKITRKPVRCFVCQLHCKYPYCNLAMFYIGSNVMDWPLEAQRALADGHEICVRKSLHAYSRDGALMSYWRRHLGAQI